MNVNLGDLTVCLDMLILNAEAARNLHFQLAVSTQHSKAVMVPAAGVLAKIETAARNGRGIIVAEDAAVEQVKKNAAAALTNVQNSILQLCHVLGWKLVMPAEGTDG